MEFNIIRLMSDPVGKQLVLFSRESWCFPRRNIRTSGLESENWQCFSRLLSRHFPPFFDPACCNVSRAGYNCSSVSRSGYIWFYSRPCDQASANGRPCLVERKSRNITNKNMLSVWLYHSSNHLYGYYENKNGTKLPFVWICSSCLAVVTP